MILLVNPRATRPGNRRFPLSVMAVGAALPPGTPLASDTIRSPRLLNAKPKGVAPDEA